MDCLVSYYDIQSLHNYRNANIVIKYETIKKFRSILSNLDYRKIDRYQEKNRLNNGAIIAVKTPIIAIESPLTAPSIAPISIAFAVPRP